MTVGGLCLGKRLVGVLGDTYPLAGSHKGTAFGGAGRQVVWWQVCPRCACQPVFLLVIAWGLATWGSVTGSVLLLLRRRLAVQVNLLVLAAMAVTFVHNYLLSDGLKIMGGAGPAIFTAVIVLIAVLLWIYARAMAGRGVLR